MKTPKIDPELVKSITTAINHSELQEKMGNVTQLWVKSRLKDLIKVSYLPSIEFLANTLARSAERDPLDDNTRMAIFLIASELLLVYNQDMPKFLRNVSVDDAEALDNVVGWMRSLITVGYILAKEGLNNEPVSDKDRA